jgi:Xaa-Pro aminopeptidase
MIRLQEIRQFLADNQLDGWLLYDFRRSNPIVHRLLGLGTDLHLTRRFVFWIPAHGEPLLLASSIETHLFEHLPFELRTYRNRHEWHAAIARILEGAQRVAVEYSPMGQLPSVSYLDAGTAEYLRSFGIELSSSADLISMIESVWTDEQIAENLVTARTLRDIMMATIEHARSLAHLRTATEHDLQQFVLQAFDRNSLITDHPPIVAVGVNTADPHYEPSPSTIARIEPDSLLLLDMWAKSRAQSATYADITWTVWLGSSPPSEITAIAQLVFAARDAALELVRRRFAQRQPLYGYEVDDAARNLIGSAGYGDYFVHRTGHNIGTDVHGYGTNMDNYETCDSRRILPGTSFSIEPGIYLPALFGIRSECDVVVTNNGDVLVPTEPLQQSLIVFGT